MTRAKRVDNNQAEIVAEFRRLGWEVIDYSDCGKGRPDILVATNTRLVNGDTGEYMWEVYPVEIKNGNAPYTKAELAFMERYPGLVTTVRSVEQVKELFG
jgi:hypothetical protein